jgi:hypothetical protein
MNKTIFVEREGYVLQITALTKEEFRKTGLPMFIDGIMCCDVGKDLMGDIDYFNVQPSCVSTASGWQDIMYQAWFPASEQRIKQREIKTGWFLSDNNEVGEFTGFENRPVIVEKTIIELSRLIDLCADKKKMIPQAKVYLNELTRLLGDMDADVVGLNPRLDLTEDDFFDNIK